MDSDIVAHGKGVSNYFAWMSVNVQSGAFRLEAFLDSNSESDSHATEACVQPLVKHEHLNNNWIGLAAALEWIALRGQPI